MTHLHDSRLTQTFNKNENTESAKHNNEVCLPCVLRATTKVK